MLALSDTVTERDRDFLASFYTLTDDAQWRLSEVDNVYCLTHQTNHLSLTLDFNSGHYRHRHNHPSKEPLIKAIKIKQKLPKTLIDATPGVLKDSLMLAGRGVNITAIERNPLLFVLVKRALAQFDESLSIDYRFGDAKEVLPHCGADAIYLDPMYPPKKKHAQVKKDMQILHHVVGADHDADDLFIVARQQHTRMIVKRPSYAEPLAKVKPDFVSQTGTTRFDVYL